MKTLYILSLVAIALGGAGLWSSVYYFFRTTPRSERAGRSEPAESADRGWSERVSVYVFSEFDSESSL